MLGCRGVWRNWPFVSSYKVIVTCKRQSNWLQSGCREWKAVELIMMFRAYYLISKQINIRAIIIIKTSTPCELLKRRQRANKLPRTPLWGSPRERAVTFLVRRTRGVNHRVWTWNEHERLVHYQYLRNNECSVSGLSRSWKVKFVASVLHVAYRPSCGWLFLIKFAVLGWMRLR